MVSLDWTLRCDLALMAICTAALALLCTSAAIRAGKRSAWTFLALFAGCQSLAAVIRFAGDWRYEAANNSLIELVIVVNSLFLLVECGRRMLRERLHWLAKPWIHLATLGLASIGIFTGTAEGISRAAWLAIGVPGAALTAWGLFVVGSSCTARVQKIWALAGTALIAFVLANGLGMQGLAALCTATLLGAFWFAVRCSGAIVLVHAVLIDRRLAVSFLLLTAIGVWSLSGAAAIDIAQAGEAVTVQNFEAWEGEPYQRWKAALPMLAIMAVLPGVGAALYWLCSGNRTTSKLRAR